MYTEEIIKEVQMFLRFKSYFCAVEELKGRVEGGIDFLLNAFVPSIYCKTDFNYNDWVLFEKKFGMFETDSEKRKEAVCRWYNCKTDREKDILIRCLGGDADRVYYHRVFDVLEVLVKFYDRM